MACGAQVTYGLPILVTLVSAKLVGDYFNHGIYDSHIFFKQVRPVRLAMRCRMRP
jgi:hypothetical protein